MTSQLYCGLDIHKDKYVACLLDKEGNELRNGSFPSTKEAITQFFSGIDNTITTVIIENCGMWRYAYKILKESGFEVILTDGTKTKKIVGQKKTDKNDAQVLSNLARTNYLPKLYIPPDDIISYRDLTHHLHSIRDIRSRYKIKIKHELIKQGIKYQPNIWNIKGHAWLRMLKITSITSLVNLLEHINKEEKEIHQQVIKLSKQLKPTKLLMSIPGIAEYLALVIYTEIGDINRFPSIKNLVMYSGLCPGIHQTGETDRQVRNIHSNRFLKYAFIEGSGCVAFKGGNKFEEKYIKIRNKKGMQTARRVIARHMATIVWHMLNKNEPYKH